MIWVIAVLLVLLLFFVVLAYCCLVVASEADEEAERMYMEWKEKHDRTDGTDDIQ